MAWWYVVLKFFCNIVDALLAADAAVAFSSDCSCVPLRVSPGQIWMCFACRGCLQASQFDCTHRTLVRYRLAVGIGSARWRRRPVIRCGLAVGGRAHDRRALRWAAGSRLRNLAGPAFLSRWVPAPPTLFPASRLPIKLGLAGLALMAQYLRHKKSACRHLMGSPSSLPFSFGSTAPRLLLGVLGPSCACPVLRA